MINLELQHPKAIARMQDETRVRSFMSLVGEERVLHWIEENNKSANLPYHNMRHAFGVAASCIDLAPLSGREEMRILVIAALMHDFNHSGGKLSDDKNIELALEGLKQIKSLLGYAYGQIEQLIRATEYPSTRIYTDVLARIIRDADAIQSYKSDGIDVIMDGLRIELGLALGKVPTYQEMYERQRAFLKERKWGTITAQNIADALTDAVLSGFASRVETADIKIKLNPTFEGRFVLNAPTVEFDADGNPTLESFMQFGYAPGNYSIICSYCKEISDGDKRAVTCKSCAEKLARGNI